MSEKEQSAPEAAPVWESIYGEGKALNRYPFDQVVSFIYRNFSRSKPRSETRILEIGCGAGNNLWFAAREGFSVTGIDASQHAIEFARKRFAEEDLQGDLRVGDFVSLPFDSDTYDFVIDRCALTCSSFASARKTIAEVRRVIAPGGKFFFNPYSDRHSSYASGNVRPDGITVDITAGTLVGIGPICFYGKRDVQAMFQQGWQMISLRHIEIMEELAPDFLSHAEWIAIGEKV
jgi:2-polyprenyl-3-methyl-5-hydroxy-6-metoxy-1,4-benzoquinol methylase